MMMSVEMHGGGGGGIGGGRFDPSDLHLKKELTQIRKAARVLRDPGTSSTWRSPLNTARSLTKHHYVHHHKNGHIDGIAKIPFSEKFPQTPLQQQGNGTNNYSNDNAASNMGNANFKDKKVFLYNWRSQKSESKRSRQIGEDSIENKKGDGSSLSQNESVDMDSLSDARNGGDNDSQTDPYFSDRNASLIFNSKDFTPSIRRAIKKSKRGNYSTASLKRHTNNHKVQEEMLLSRYAKNGLIDHSDDTEDYCNPEDLRGASAISPFLDKIKNKGWAPSNRKEDDSISYSTPALSTSSFNKYGIRRNTSIVESWDATTGSFNDADDEVDDDQLDLPGRQGCGIPCYWSKKSTPKSRIGYGSCSPSLSDTLRRKGSSILCGNGNRTMYRKTNHRSSLTSKNRRLNSRKAAQSLVPLLTNNGSGNSEDEISDNFGELYLEALSRLDGRRWSTSCKSQEGLELVAFNGELESSPENVRSLSHKYRPMFFDELIGQNMVVKSLASALSRKRIAPIYLFQGPRGTGKTSTARIFAAALNCLAAEDSKPCGVCRECANFISGKSKCIKEVDGSYKTGVDKIKYHLKNLSVVNSEYKVFVVEECHLLPSKTWLTFLRLLEKPLSRVVFILVTTDIDNVPRAILSRCQRHLFNKISSADIVIRLRKIVNDENLDVESDVFELIASNADGSLRDAETMLDQLSLFGKRINASLVNELIGVVSDEKLLDLLEIAMSSNATETVIRARELMDSGVDPIVLMSQMATLIVDIIAGTYPNIHAKHNDSSFFGTRSLSEREIERLKHALTVLSEAEKHLRVSSERSTWFTATLLQLGSVPSPDRTHSGLSSRRQSSKATEEDYIDILTAQKQQQQRTDDIHFEKSVSPTVAAAHHNSTSKENTMSLTSFNSNPNQSHSKMLLNIWEQCIEKCHSKTLRQLLQSYGKLVSISEMKGGFVAHVAFIDSNVKTRAEGFLSSITNSFEIVLRRNVEVKIILVLDSFLPKPMDRNNIAINPENRSTRSNISEGIQTEPIESKEKKMGIPVQRIESIIREQRLETAWLQAMEKGGTPAGSMSRFKPERNQVLPNEMESINSMDIPLQQQCEDELNHEIKVLKINEAVVTTQKDQIAKRIGQYPVSPSLLHNSSFASNFSKDNIGYESGSGAVGCNGLFCWNSTRAQRRTKAKRGTLIRGRKSGRFSWFRECAKARSSSRYNNR